MSRAHPSNSFSRNPPHCSDPSYGYPDHDHASEYFATLQNLHSHGITSTAHLHSIFQAFTHNDPRASQLVEHLHMMGADTALLEHFEFLPRCTFGTSAYDVQASRERAFGPGGSRGGHQHGGHRGGMGGHGMPDPGSYGGSPYGSHAPPSRRGSRRGGSFAPGSQRQPSRTRPSDSHRAPGSQRQPSRTRPSDSHRAGPGWNHASYESADEED